MDGAVTLPNGYLPLHGDDPSPQPHPTFNNYATVNIFLTDVTEESGCLAFVPGSHKRLRQPTAYETALPGARTVYTPEFLAQRESMPPPEIPPEIEGDTSTFPPWLVELHNKMALITA